MVAWCDDIFRNAGLSGSGSSGLTHAVRVREQHQDDAQAPEELKQLQNSTGCKQHICIASEHRTVVEACCQ